MRTFSLRQLAWKSAIHHRRTAIQVALGTAMASAVLTGALIVGDSVRYSLTRFALLRLGKVETAMTLMHRFGDARLADEMKANSGVEVVAVLRLPGMAMHDEDSDAARQVNRVQVIGVTPLFWKMGEVDPVSLSGQQVAIGARLADALGVREGDSIAIRVSKPSLFSRQAPMASRKEKLVLRSSMVVVRILNDESMGRFSLDANQVAPYNLFVSLDWLQERVELPGKANLFLAAGRGAGEQEVTRALRSAWSPAYAGLKWKEDGTVTQIESDRVYLEPSVVTAVTNQSVVTLSYLVSSISNSDGTRMVPYSFAVACTPTGDSSLGPVPVGMRDDEILVNSWVCDKLGVKTGETVKVTYHALLDTDKFESRSRTFTVRGVIPVDSLSVEAALVPKFPGLTDVNSCREWDIGMPTDEALLKDEDNEAYWQKYRTAPKAFVTIAAGQAMWGNRFGDTTAIRIPTSAAAVDAAKRALRDDISPASLGFVFLPVREQALRAVEQGMDFGELFLGMSFFLIIAALLLTGMLFAFGVEQRSEEMGILAAQGFRPIHLRLMFLGEGAVLAIVGSLAGVILATFYTQALIYGLSRYWKDAVAASAIYYHSEPQTFAIGALSSIVCAMAALLVAVWHQTKRPARELLELDITQSSTTSPTKRPGWITWSLAVPGGVAALVLVWWGTTADPKDAVGVFFSAGMLLLLAGLALLKIALHVIDSRSAVTPSIASMGRRNAARRVGRSIAVAALLACGSFMVFAVSSMRQDVRATAHRRDSGTGGFSIFAESSFDIPEDLNTLKGRRLLIPKPDEWPAGLDIVPINVHDGDDASCLNLNRAQSPRLLGVDPEALAQKKAFFEEKDEGLWSALDTVQADGAVPALAGDGNTIQYGLGRKVGDTLTFIDEKGNQFQVRLVGVLPHHISIFQGSLLIPLKSFHEKFPSSGGFRIALLDIPSSTPRSELESVTRRLTSAGIDITRTDDRLAMFYSVEETYLQMFLVLGGLGLLLGSIGLGIMVLRNVFERRGELAMLLCVGYTNRQVAAMVVAEHTLLLLGGTAVGVVASAAAMWPSVSAPGVTIPVGLLGALLVGMLVLGFVWTVGAARLALRGRLMDAIRNE